MVLKRLLFLLFLITFSLVLHAQDVSSHLLMLSKLDGGIYVVVMRS